MILSFDTEAEAQTGTDQIWVNIITYCVDNDLTIIDPEGEIITSLSGLTDPEILALRICGECGSKTAFIDGLTYDYAIVQKAYLISKWYISTVGAQFLTGVTGYTEQELPESWKQPFPIT